MALLITKSNNITNFKTTYHVLLKTELNKTFSIYGDLKKQISHFAESQSFEGNYNESLVFNDIDNEKSSLKKFIGLGVKKELNNEKIFRCASSITYSIVSSKQKISSLIYFSTLFSLPPVIVSSPVSIKVTFHGSEFLACISKLFLDISIVTSLL